jgi:hypothetical protein
MHRSKEKCLQSNRARAAIILGALGLGAVLFVVLQGGGDNNSSTQTTQPATPSGQEGARGASGANGSQNQKPPYVVVVRNGKPVGGIEKMDYKTGEQVRFVVRSDVADEIHVHGYDRLGDVKAGGSVRFEFPAKIEGLFVVELEQRGEQIAQLRVNPS